MLGIFLDLETTGPNTNKHRVLEIAFKIIDVYTGDLKETYEAVIYQPDDVWEKSHPEMLQINGLTRDFILTGHCEIEISKDIIHLFKLHGAKEHSAVFICQNTAFTKTFFSQIIESENQIRFSLPNHWLDLTSMHWALYMQSHQYSHHIPHPYIPLSEDQISLQYNLEPESRPHRAMNGVNHLVSCYEAIVGYPNKHESTSLSYAKTY